MYFAFKRLGMKKSRNEEKKNEENNFYDNHRSTYFYNVL